MWILWATQRDHGDDKVNTNLNTCDNDQAITA